MLKYATCRLTFRLFRSLVRLLTEGEGHIVRPTTRRVLLGKLLSSSAFLLHL